MRSRYVAYTRQDIDYIGRTHAEETRGEFDAEAARRWAAEATWQGLEILSTERGGVFDDNGRVMFVATFRQGGATLTHQEVSEFRKTPHGEWRFVRGAALAHAVPATSGKVGRNAPCPCGSGRKFKVCCAA